MKKLSLTVQSREHSGSCWARRIRRTGNVPAILYGKSGTRLLAVNERIFSQFKKNMGSGAALIELTDEKNHQVLTLIKGVQQHVISRQFLNIDFHEVDANTEVHFNLIVHTKGEAHGVKTEGGILDIQSHELHVKALPAVIPEFIEVDVTQLKLGEAICVRDLKPVKGLTITNDPNQVVVACVVVGKDKSAASDTEATAATPAK